MATALKYQIIDGGRLGVGNIADVDSAQRTVDLGSIVKGRDPTYGEAEFIYVKFTGTVNAGDFVIVDRYNKTAIQSPAAAANAKGFSVGVAMGTAAAGQFGLVMIRGVYDVANVVTGTAAGVLLSGSATVGQASTAVVNFNFDVAVCKTLAAANVAAVELYWPVCNGR